MSSNDRSSFSVFDMAGNVAEWVRDVYSSSYYRSAAVKDPAGPDKPGARVVRGGSWHDAASYLRAAMRSKSLQTNRLDDIGFRCARAAP
jgi:formylglycine-generating enzyme required for sulfatase activity